MAFKHNSEVAEREPGWGSVDKTKLPQAAFADHGEAGKKSTWGYPHHWVQNGGDPDENGCYTTGIMYLHKGGLNAAWAAAQGARSGEQASATVTSHLSTHRKALGLDQGQRENAVLNAEIPVLEGGEVPEWVMIARTGRWEGHPSGPELITATHLASALAYYERHYEMHGADLPIDYHHASIMVPERAVKAPAAGWIQDMQLRANGMELWARVMWTAEAAREIAGQQFRYLSPALDFDMPDRVTGAPVPMAILSVALTNTPFLTELAALNARPAASGDIDQLSPTERAGATGRDQPGTSVGGEDMEILNSLAAALEKQPEEVASELGLDPAAEQKVVANAICEAFAKRKELEARPLPVVNDAIAALLGMDAGAEERAVKVAVLKLQSGASLNAVRARLGLGEDADDETILNAIGELQTAKRKTEAEELVDGAVQAGKIPPARRDFWLNVASSDLEAAQEAINSLPVLTQVPQHGNRPNVGGPRELTEQEKAVCKQMSLTEEQYRTGMGEG